jgi:hypothetical protein
VRPPYLPFVELPVPEDRVDLVGGLVYLCREGHTYRDGEALPQRPRARVDPRDLFLRVALKEASELPEGV